MPLVTGSTPTSSCKTLLELTEDKLCTRVFVYSQPHKNTKITDNKDTNWHLRQPLRGGQASGVT